MKVATFNLYQYLEPGNYWYQKKSKNKYSPEKWEEKREWIKNTLNDLAADIVGFQEVFSKKSLKQLCSEAGYTNFASVGSVGRDETDPTIYNHPVVALASKYPIRSVSEVGTSGELVRTLGLKEGFSFSRTPIKALIETEEFGLVRVYVLHLKSKRPLYTKAYDVEDELEDRVLQEMIGQSKGKIASLLQRGTEAASLASDVIIEQRYSALPTIVLGDINCDFNSVEYDSMCPTGYYTPKIEGPSDYEDSANVKPIYDKLKLYSGYSVADTKSNAPTHYFGSKGSTLDYAFVTQELINSVTEHKVWNEHIADTETLKELPGADKKATSDHAVVSLEINP
ncbi:endonuclease/exonuclease/phosphatase family protein [Agarivorans aestuarii]|uniref:Endonuclease/exonuclease/phosphatase family protein n=1 Tax=Agarivorans aestuarii TaxID=1563703 RepID=A0ABU7G314_9ALTE|nr:endonuclease/exonuclease/phosphatase family protein [Agarivorans aestuarii]MEE1673711.1 endonuclease/exonuclease/phosphatase family protein [Agarivorans aestuarii]